MSPDMMRYWLSQLEQPTPQVISGQRISSGMPHELQSPEAEQQAEAEGKMGGVRSGWIPDPNKNPIKKGAESGMEAARQSLNLSDTQRNRAIGHGLMAFSANMNRPKHGPGFAGTLGAINEAMNPALQAYVNRQDKEMEMNAALLKREDELQKQQMSEARQAVEAQDLRNYREQHLAIEQLRATREGRGPKLTKDERLEQKIEERQKLIPEGTTPMEAYAPGTQRDIMKDLTASVKSGQKGAERIRIRNKMKAISDRNPGMATDFTRILGENLDKASINGIFGGMFADKKKLADLQLMGKYQQDLNKHHIEGVSGKIVTDVYKKLLSDITPGARLTKEAFDRLIEAGDEEDKPLYEYSKKAKSAIQGRYYIPPYLEEAALAEETAPAPMAGNGGFSQEALDIAAQELANGH